MYSGVEYVVCCYSECISTPGKLKNQPDHGGNRTRDLWFASPMLYQLSYEVKSYYALPTELRRQVGSSV